MAAQIEFNRVPSVVAIPSYSEVLFLLGYHADLFDSQTRVAIPSYSEVLFLLRQGEYFFQPVGSRNPFLFRGPIPTNLDDLISNELKVAIPSYSEVLFLPIHSSSNVR